MCSHLGVWKVEANPSRRSKQPIVFTDSATVHPFRPGSREAKKEGSHYELAPVAPSCAQALLFSKLGAGLDKHYWYGNKNLPSGCMDLVMHDSPPTLARAGLQS